MESRDMMQYGYFQGMPGNMMYGNFAYQGPPGSLISNMPNNYMMSNNQSYDNSIINNLNEINNRISKLEARVKVLESNLSNNNSYDNSMYML